MIDKTEYNRRDFLKKTAGSTIAVSSGVMLTSLTSPANALNEGASESKRWAMLIDVNKCKDGCDDCVQACQQENGWGEGSKDEQHSNELQKAQWIRAVTIKDKETGYTSRLPIMCQHCEHPPCVDVCPTGASFKRVDGIVLVDKHRCIGCRYCMMACPFKARSFIHEALHEQKAYAPRGKGTVESCTLCVHRVDAGMQPACVEKCESGAMVFGDMKDPQSEISKQLKKYGGTKIRDDFGLNQAVRYRGI